MRRMNRGITIILTGLIVMSIGLAGCSGSTNQQKKTSNETNLNPSGEKITLRILENDTAKKEGYLEALLKAFNEAYKDQGIEAVDANMDEYTNLAENGPYGYGPDVIYQANDKLMTYAADKHILPLNIEEFECYSHVPNEAWDAFRLSVDGTQYCCGVPVNIQEPMLFYRKDMLPVQWEIQWDKDGNGVADFLENWNDLYAYSASIRETDSNRYGFMSSFNNLYLNGEFLFSYGAYVFGKNEDGTLNSKDIGFGAADAAKGIGALKQFAALMDEGCIDDTILTNRYEKIADGSYFAAVSTPDTYVLFINKLSLHYQDEGLTKDEADEKAKENLMMVELPGKLPLDGDLTKDSSTMKDADWTDTIVMGGVNGYGISSYTKYREACIAFVDFATSYEMIETRMEMLGIAPTRSDVAKASGGVTDMIFKSLEEGRIYLMPSIKAVDQIWTPSQTLMGDVAKDPFRENSGETTKYDTTEKIQDALNKVSEDVYDAIYTLAE